MICIYIYGILSEGVEAAEAAPALVPAPATEQGGSTPGGGHEDLMRERVGNAIQVK